MKQLKLTFLLTILISMVGVKALAYDAKVNGIYYNFSETNATVTYYSSSSSSNQSAYTGSVVIPETVMYNGTTYFVASIDKWAFYGCSGLTSVTIPNSVTSIGNYAFYNCSSLTSVTVEMEMPVNIANSTFSNRKNATLYVPYGCKAAYESAAYWKDFKEIVELERHTPNIVFSDANVKVICVANWDTNSDGELSEAEAAAVTRLGTVFENNTIIQSFNELSFFTSLTSIDGYEFKDCSKLTSIVIPSNVQYISFSAFDGCSAIVTVNNDYYKSIGDGVYKLSATSSSYKSLVFVNGSCTSFTVPSDVNNIDNNAFRYATKLNKLVFEENEESYSLNNRLFGTCPLKELYLGGNISYNGGAFFGIETLEKVTFGSKVTSLGDYMFYNCCSLNNVVSEGNITSVGAYTFNGTPWLQSNGFNGVVYLGNYAAGYDGVTKIVSFKSNTTGYAKNFFSGEELTKVTLPASMNSIPVKMFYQSKVDEVIIPQNIKTISYNSFGYAEIKKLNIQETDEVLKVYASYSDPFGAFELSIIDNVSIGRPMESVDNNNGLTNGRQYAHPFGCAAIGEAIITKPMDISGLFDGCAIKQVTLPQGLASIGNNTFRRQYYGQGGYNIYPSGASQYELTNIDIPSTVESIGSEAFAGHNITNIHIPNSVISIGEKAFIWNNAETLCLPISVKSIGEGAFLDNLLTSITVYNPIPVSINDKTFSHQELTTLYVPYGCKSAYENADYWKDFKEILEIDNRIAQTLTLTEIPAMTYGDAAYNLPQKTTEGLTLTWNVSNNAVASVSGNKLNIVGAGTTTVTATQAGNDDYKPFSREFTLTVGKAMLTVTANDCTKQEGEENPPLTVSYSGFKYSDDASSLTNQPTVTTTATTTSPAGTYPITASGAESNNYEFTYVDGTLTIMEKPVVLEPTNISQLSDALYINAFEGRIGDDVDIEVRLKNAENVTSYGFELVLPEGMSIETTSDGSFDEQVTLSTCHKGHTAVTNKQSATTYKVAVASMSSKSLTGNDGIVVTVKAHVDDKMAVGEYAVWIQNPLLVYSDGTKPTIQPTMTVVTIEDYTKGDVDGDGVIDLADAVLVINRYVGKLVDTFNEKAADVDGDNVIDLADAVRIISFYVGKINSLSRSMDYDGPEPQ